MKNVPWIVWIILLLVLLMLIGLFDRQAASGQEMTIEPEHDHVQEVNRELEESGIVDRGGHGGRSAAAVSVATRYRARYRHRPYRRHY